MVARASHQGLDISFKSLERQRADVDGGVIEVSGETLSKRKSIALSRTMLQHYLFLEAKPRQGSVVWILDDDVVLEGLAYEADGSIGVVEADYVEAILRLKRDWRRRCHRRGDRRSSSTFASAASERSLLTCTTTFTKLAALEPNSCYPDRRDEKQRYPRGST